MKAIFAALIFTLSFGCAHFFGEHDGNHHEHESSQVKEPADWDGIEVASMGRHYFSKTPTSNSLTFAKQEGIEAVINLTEETDKSIEEASKAKGIAYYHIVVPANEPFSKERFAEIEKVHKEHHGKVWVFCRSGNRAAGWFATHLSMVEGMPLDDSISLAEKLGLTSEATKDKVREYAR
ncbi:MAG: sulfur transferase domain-containing protein [Oligoflexales bacterium]